MFLFRDVQQESLIAVDFSGGIARREAALQRRHDRSVFAPQTYFEVAYKVIRLDLAAKYAALLRRGIELRVHTTAQQFFAAGMAKHADECVIAVEQFAIRRRHKHAFLHLFEKGTVLLLGSMSFSDAADNVYGAFLFRALIDIGRSGCDREASERVRPLVKTILYTVAVRTILPVDITFG